MKPRVKSFDIPVYSGKVACFSSQSALEKWSGYNIAENLGEGVTGICVIVEDGWYALGVFDGSIDTLVHECGHLTLFVLERAGINAHDSSGETYCYLLGELFSRVRPLLRVK